MKKLLLLSVIGIISWTSYSDITNGTLPSVYKTQDNSQSQLNINYKRITVNPGDTVLSIVEKINPHKSLSIEKVMSDFKKLNPGCKPNKIEIGQSYNFPQY
ncbi:hypothetical protein JOD45_001992 [Scopulibacillus daqui]|uniref:LysM domain-containing protein n=1 Tax=Scopulibacillus daqui TaxID=1469162 RepID=A0ABS2Q0Q5_9BACL|nr:hypothetical protein [Scopulibacillus daqui]MBM7645773.1 hypothetical protein [Scopulibacillus daqui]